MSVCLRSVRKAVSLFYSFRFVVFDGYVTNYCKNEVCNLAFKSCIKTKSCSVPFLNWLSQKGEKIASHLKREHNVALLASILTWLGLQKEEDPLISVIKQAMLSFNRKDYDNAETILHLALKLAQERENKQAQLYIFDMLANVAFEKGDLAKSEKLFIEVTTELIAKGTPIDANSIVDVSIKLASIYAKRGEKEKAEIGYKFCIDTQEKKVEKLGESNIDSLTDEEKDTLLLLGMCREWYAKFLFDYGRIQEAKENYEKALDISERVNGPGHTQTLVLLNDIGTLLCYTKDFTYAIECFKKAVARSVGSDSEDIPVFYCNLGAAYLEMGNVKEGETACKVSLKLAKKFKHKFAQEEAERCLKSVKKMNAL